MLHLLKIAGRKQALACTASIPAIKRFLQRFGGHALSAVWFIVLVIECTSFYAVFFPLWFVCLCWKAVAWILLKVFYRNSASLMAASDALCAHKPQGTCKEALITAMFNVSGPVDLVEFRERVRLNLVDARDGEGQLVHRRLRQCIEKHFGFYCWADVPSNNFDVDYHVDAVRLPPNMQKPVKYRNRREMLRIMQRIIDEPVFPPKIAPWRIMLLAKEDDTETLVLLRSHHVLFDAGAAFLVLLPGLADGSTYSSNAFGHVRLSKQDGRAARLLLWRNSLIGLSHVPRLWNRQLAIYDENWYKRVAEHNSHVPGKWAAWSETGIPVGDVLGVRRATGVKFSSVIMSCVARAIVLYAKKVGKLSGEDTSCRSASGYQAISVWTPLEKPKLGNHVTALSTPFIINDEDFASENDEPEVYAMKKEARLRQLFDTDRYQSEWIRSEFIWGVHFWSGLACNTILPMIMELHAVQRIFAGVTVFVSCMQGPKERFSIGGNQVVQTEGVMPLPPEVGIGFVFMTYGDRIWMSVAGRKSVFRTLDEMEQLIELFVQDLQSLNCFVAA